MELRNGKKQMSNKEVIGTLLLSILAAVVVFFTATLCLYNKRKDTFIEYGIKELNNEEYVYYHECLYKSIDYETNKEELNKQHWASKRHKRRLNGEEEIGFDPWMPSQADYILLPGKIDIIAVWTPVILQRSFITSDLDNYHPEYVNVYASEYNEYYKICD